MAKEYAEAMWLMLQQEEADDLRRSTGESHSVENFWRKHSSYCGP